MTYNKYDFENFTPTEYNYFCQHCNFLEDKDEPLIFELIYKGKSYNQIYFMLQDQNKNICVRTIKNRAKGIYKKIIKATLKN